MIADHKTHAGTIFRLVVEDDAEIFYRSEDGEEWVEVREGEVPERPRTILRENTQPVV